MLGLGRARDRVQDLEMALESARGPVQVQVPVLVQVNREYLRLHQSRLDRRNDLCHLRHHHKLPMRWS